MHRSVGWTLGLLMVVGGCEAKPAQPTGPPDEREEMAEEPTPSESDGPPPVDCTPVATDEQLQSWVLEVDQRIVEDQLDSVRQHLSCVDSDFAGDFLNEAESQKAELFRGQLDADPAREAVVQVTQHGEMVGAGERDEFYWLGIFDNRDDEYIWVASIVRPQSVYCSQAAGNAGLTFDFVEEEPGENAGIWVQQAHTEACGRMVDVSYTKTLYQLADGKLVSKGLEPRERESWDRTDPPPNEMDEDAEQ